MISSLLPHLSGERVHYLTALTVIEYSPYAFGQLYWPESRTPSTPHLFANSREFLVINPCFLHCSWSQSLSRSERAMDLLLLAPMCGPLNLPLSFPPPIPKTIKQKYPRREVNLWLLVLHSKARTFCVSMDVYDWTSFWVQLCKHPQECAGWGGAYD